MSTRTPRSEDHAPTRSLPTTRGHATPSNQTRTACLTIATLVLFLIITPSRIQAQDVTLEDVEWLLEIGDYSQARAAIHEWWESETVEDASVQTRARALLLRARLTTDLDEAERDYLNLVLAHPNTPEVPEALLRLGQGLLARGDSGRAVGYLHRLVTDYPRSIQRPIAMLWLARARRAEERYEDACRIAREGVDHAREDPALLGMIRAEEQRACDSVELDRAKTDPEVTERTEPTEAAEPKATKREDTAETKRAREGPYSAQVGAFRGPSRAEELVQKLQEAGYDARTATLPGDDLIRVRVGQFTQRNAARSIVDQLKSDGYEALIVTDAARENPVH